jgi:dipeptidyl aminopeptidase/acylaminoacyl peptidase
MRALFAVCFALTALAQTKRPITHEDVWMMKRVGATIVSPDGRWAVASVTEPAYDADKTVTDLWIAPADGSRPPRRLTATKGAESQPVFSPDSSRIAFSAKREGDDQPQVYVLSLEGGEAVRMTDQPGGAFGPQWRPDGQALLFQSRLYPGPAAAADQRRIAAERKARKENVRVYDSFPFRYWDQWLDDLVTHILVQEAKPGAAVKDLLAGTRLVDSPGFDGSRGGPNGDHDLEPVWSPDGLAVVFSATVERNREAYSLSSTQLYRVAAAGGEPEAITKGPDSYRSPRFRPDGRALYASHSRRADTQLYSLTRLAMMPWPAAGTSKVLTDGWDRSVDSYAFSPDSKTILIVAEEAGNDKLFQMAAEGGAVATLIDLRDGCYAGIVSAEKSPQPVYIAAWGSMTHPNDIARIDAAGKSHRLLSGFNDSRIAEIDWAPPRHHWFNARSGKAIHSLVVLPPSFDPSRKYPLLLFPHGGPHNMTKDTFFVRWNYHLLTSPGYVLLMTNYTGSTGFGEKFAAAIHDDVLRGPGKEIEEAADAAIRDFPFVDAARQAAAGASYGGYLMNWFAGNTTRFKALVNHAGLTDNASMWGSTDGAFYWEQRMGSPVWELKGAWRDQNPAAYAGNFTTPMLVTHGELDYRVPVSQAYEIFKLLQRQRVASRLVIFPEENHWILKGWDSKRHMDEVLGWLKKYLQ